MFRFANIEFLYIGIPVILVLCVGYAVLTAYKRRQIKAFGDPELIASLMPNASRFRPALKFGILMVALTMLVLAAARPQLGVKKNQETHQGIDAMVALDISNSMLAEDVSPCRLDRAKQLISKLVDNMRNDRVGLVVFAGDAFTQLPITTDFTAAKTFLNALTPDLIRMQGTAIGAALECCMAGFDEELSNADRTIIIITDGENHEDDAVAVAQRAKEAGIRVIVVGIGSPQGATIPVPGKGTRMKDKQGNLVVTKLNEEMCQQIAQAGAGVYVHCDNTNNALKAIQEEIEHMATDAHEGVEYTDYNEQYPSFVIVALILLILEFFIFNRKNKLLTKMDIFGEKTLFLAVLLAMSTTAFAQRESREIRRGNALYEQGEYGQAELEYRRALEINSDNYAAQVNVGNAVYRQAEELRADTAHLDESRKALSDSLYAVALREYGKAARLMDEKHANDPLRYSKAVYNAGNCFTQLNQMEAAAEAYKEALRKNPKDEEARKNLALLLNQPPQQQQQQQQQQPPQEDKEDQMDQEAAAQILQALEDKQPQQQQQGRPNRQIEKNW